MTARRAYPMIYQRIIRDLDEDGRLEIDAILGDPDALATRRSRQMDVLAMAGIEFG